MAAADPSTTNADNNSNRDREEKEYGIPMTPSGEFIVCGMWWHPAHKLFQRIASESATGTIRVISEPTTDYHTLVTTCFSEVSELREKCLKHLYATVGTQIPVCPPVVEIECAPSAATAGSLLLLLAQATELRAKLLEFYEATNELADIPPEVAAQLRVPLCRVTRRVVPDVQTKINEIVRAADENLTVSTSLHGHDLEGDDGRRYEEKTSRVIRRTNKCNFSWPLPTGAMPMLRRAKLLESIEEKTGGGGGAIFTINDAMGRELKTYRLSGAFLLEYFKYLPFTDKQFKHNMGSTFCWTCKSCPRMDRIQHANDVFKKNHGAVVMGELFVKIPPHKH